MRFLVTMNMPSASGMDTHQMTLEHPVKSQEELCALLNRVEFIIFRMFYKRKNMSGEMWWQDRGEIIVNTSWIGKAQEFMDFESDEDGDVHKRPHNQR
jgi:hypothetical protein